MTSSLMLKDELTKARNELNNLRKALRSLQAKHKNDTSRIESLLTYGNTSFIDEGQKCAKKLQNDSTSQSYMCNDWTPIGYISSWFRSKNGTPRQGSVNSLTRGKLRLEKFTFNNPHHALQGLDQYSHVWIFFIFDKNTDDGRGHKKAKVSPPRLDGQRVGVFATRSPHRPNPLGLTLARLDKIEDDCLYLSGLDILDGTPVLDIKPYIFQYDAPPSVITQLDSQTSNYCSNEYQNPHYNDSSSSTYQYNYCQQNPLSVIEDDRPPSQMDNTHGFSSSNLTRTEKETVALAIRKSTFSDRVCENHCSHLCYSQQETSTNNNFDFEKQQIESRSCVKLVSNDKEDPEDDFKEKESDSAFVNLSPLKSDIDSEVDYTFQSSKVTKSPHSSLTHTEHSYSIENIEKIKDLNLNSGKTKESGFSSASWVKSPPIAPLQVYFTPVAESQLNMFSSTAIDDFYRLEFLSDGVELRSAISGLLCEDPRSTYRRQKCPSLLYYFTVDIAHITAWFDGSIAEVLRVKPYHS